MTARKLPSTAAATAASRKRRRRRATAGWLAAVVTAMLVVLTAVLPLTRDDDGLARARHGARHPHHLTTIERSAAHRRGRRHPAPPPSAQAGLTIGARAGVTRVPRSFFGLSTEYGALPLYERHVALFERALSLLRVPGDGPLILRIGGDSADRTFWDPSLRSMPSWAYRLTPTWVAKLSALVLRERLRLILDLNLVTGKPAIAAQWARAAEALLPRRSIVGFEVGNEPDLYAHWYWLASIGRTRLAAEILPRALSAGIYTHDFQAYAHALSTIAPGVPLAGPALANPQGALSWITSLIAAPHPGLGIISAHRYPFSPCVKRTSPEYPTTERLLSQAASAGLARSVRGAVAQAHRAGLVFRLTELNSVTCGGLNGVSDSFATALWAPDTLFDLLRAGVDGVNVHIRDTTINAPFSLGDRGLRARPLLYGLLMFVRTLGRNAALVRSHLHARAVPAPDCMGGASTGPRPARAADRQGQSRGARAAQPPRPRPRHRRAAAGPLAAGHVAGHPGRPARGPGRRVRGFAHRPDGAARRPRLYADDPAGQRGARQRQARARRPERRARALIASAPVRGILWSP